MKITSVVSLVLAAVICLFALVGCGQEKDKTVPDGMKLASGEQVDYYMYVPETWRVDKSDLYTGAYFSSGDPTSISATAYGISADIATVDDWWKTFEKQMSDVYTDVSKVAKADAKIDGIKGREYTFTAKLGGEEYTFIITAVIRDYYVYYITYTSTPEFNENHLEDREKVIDSFEFKD